MHTSSSIVYCPWPRFMGLHPARLSLCAPLRCAGASAVRPCLSPVGRAQQPSTADNRVIFPSVLGSPAFIGSELSSLVGSGLYNACIVGRVGPNTHYHTHNAAFASRPLCVARGL